MDNMNFAEFQKDVLIFDMTFPKFKKYYGGVFHMLNNGETEKALNYANTLSYANVKCTKLEMHMYKVYMENLKALITPSINDENNISAKQVR